MCLDYDKYTKASWDKYIKLFHKYNLGSGCRHVPFEEWPQEVKDAYENHRYQFELNSLCEIDMAESTKWMK